MVILDTVGKLVSVRLKRVLDAAELVLSTPQFLQFRKIVLNEFGRSGLLGDLERESRNQDRHG